MALIDTYRDQFGVEPICQVLEVAPSTYYAAKSRPTSARRLRDEELKVEIARVHEENFGVYGIEKVWRQLNREGVSVGRDRVARLMQELNLEGVVRGQRKRTTVASDLDERPADLVDRNFRAPAPNRLCVADLTYVSTWSGFVYMAFVIDAFSRSIVAGGSPTRFMPSWPWTRWRWRYGCGGTRSWRAWSTTPTAAGSTWPSATPSAWPRLAPFARSVPAVTAMTTPWQRRWLASTRPSSSTAEGPGATSSRSSWQPPPGWTGGTSVGSMALSTTCRQPSSSAGGGTRRRPMSPDVVLCPAPPSRRLGGEMTWRRRGHRRRCPVSTHAVGNAAQRQPPQEDQPPPLPSSTRDQRGLSKSKPPSLHKTQGGSPSQAPPVTWIADRNIERNPNTRLEQAERLERANAGVTLTSVTMA